MVSEEQAGKIFGHMAEPIYCHECGVRIRFGDYDCPRCGADIEELLRAWARQLLQIIGADEAAEGTRAD